MKTSTLREVSKFASGLVAGDFAALVWLYTGKLLPIDFWGINFTEDMALAAMVFDVLLFLLLAHYAWHAKFPSPSIRKRNFFYLSGVLLGLVAILHLLRLIFGVDIVIGDWQAPLWLSGLGTVVTGYLSFASWKFAANK